ncbi:MAG: N-acetyltransferase family protein [Candidatus Poseidoniales archaeon]|jgi:ribosomal protein S18 acetylase RimI-like enzyme|tara:strand:+ start:303 stop:758 length:456 start_codon:yes stop_codon:yes gene_type:complete
MSSDEITIHNAAISDIEEVARLFDAYREFYGKTSDISLSKDFLSDRITSEESTVLFARIKGECVGFVQLYPLFSSVRATRLLVLNDLYVDSLQRRKGVAKQLMESAVLVARASNCRGMILETTDDNTSAQLLYEKLGWAEESGVKHYSLDL